MFVALGQTGLGPLMGDVTGVVLVFTFMVTGAPVPQPFVSVQVIVPPVAPQFIVMECVPCPLTIVAPAGTTQLYVEPAVFVTE